MKTQKKNILLTINELLPKLQRRMPGPIRQCFFWSWLEDFFYMRGVLWGSNSNTIAAIHKTAVTPLDWFAFAGRVFPAHQHQDEILRFLDLAKSHKPQVVIEIGTARSGTQFLLGQILDSVQLIIALDLQVRNKSLLRMFSRQSLKRICLEGSSYDPLTFIKVRDALGDRLIDVLFIDGDHSFEGVSADYSIYLPLVRDGGLIAFHDIVPDHHARYGLAGLGWSGGVPQFWSQLKANSPDSRYHEFISDPDQDGMGIGVLEK